MKLCKSLSIIRFLLVTFLLLSRAPVANGDDWAQTGLLTASDGDSNDQFGSSVAIFNNIALIGAKNDDLNRGSAYIFQRSNSGYSWNQIQKLQASDGSSGDQFGYSLSICDGSVLIGAPFKNSDRGSAYFFQRGVTGSWNEVSKVSGTISSGRLGYGVAISNLVAFVGVPGVAKYATYPGCGTGNFYKRQNVGASWVFDQSRSYGQRNVAFGAIVSASNDVVLVGIPRYDHTYYDTVVSNQLTLPDVGLAYFYPGRGVKASDFCRNQYFGTAVSIQNNLAIIGATGCNRGAYLFQRSSSGWGQAAKLTASSGQRVSIYDKVALTESGGLIYFFYKSGATTWNQQATTQYRVSFCYP